VTAFDPLSIPPSAHLRHLAGVDLVEADPPVVRAEAASQVAVVLSRSRQPAREVFLDHCRRDGVPIIVRPSGGGAVVLAPGVVAASVLVAAEPDERFPESYFQRFCTRSRVALESIGVSGVAVRGISDLCLGDRKVAGSSLRLWRGRVLFQLAVLVDVDVGVIERYLAHPSREPAYRRGRPHREFVATLVSAGFPVSREAVVQGLLGAFAAARLG
jgi:lipoate-protein ligase A